MTRREQAAFDARGYWERRLTETYAVDGVGWAGLGPALNDWMYRVRRRVFVRALRPHLSRPETARVLDIGTGTGFYVDRWHELGFRNVHASDVSEVAVERLRERYPSCEVAQLDIGDQSAGTLQRRFDVVSIIDVLFHITSDRRYERAFANLARLVKPNGLLSSPRTSCTTAIRGRPNKSIVRSSRSSPC